MEQKNKILRRSFLSGLGLVAAAGVAARMSKPASVPAEPVAENADPQGDGYRLTEHIKNYYRTTAI